MQQNKQSRARPKKAPLKEEVKEMVVWRPPRQVRQSRPRAPRSEAPVALAFTGKQPSVFMKSGVPKRPGASIRLSGCDYIGPVTGNTTETDVSLQLTPSSSETFPRLSAIATIFEKYNFDKLRFVIVGVAASTTAGAMTAAPSYASSEESSATAALLRNREGQRTTRLWETNVVSYDCRRAGKPWFSCAVAETASDAIFGWYYYAIDALAAVSTVGDLFVEYEVEFAEGRSSSDVALVKKPIRSASLPPQSKSRC